MAKRLSLESAISPPEANEEKIPFPSENSPQPSGAQSLRIRKRLWALRRGSLAVPAEDGRPALPLRTNRPSFFRQTARRTRYVFWRARILCDSRLEGWENSLEKFLLLSPFRLAKGLGGATCLADRQVAERIFIYEASSPKPEAALGRREANRKNWRAGPTSEGRLKPLSNLRAANAKSPSCFLYPKDIFEILTSLFPLPTECPSAERPPDTSASAAKPRGGRGCLKGSYQ